jgi:hypothetical protein
MRLEAAEAARWLEEELEGPLAVVAHSAGEGSTSGATRRLVMEQMEETHYKLLTKAILLYNDQDARPCWSWPDRDKQTTAWLLTLTGLTGPEFAEPAATQLCLPSPACSSRIGETIRGTKKIDLFGDNVRAAKLPGDGFRSRHDLVKNFLFRKLKASGVPTICEVFNVFARELPQEGLSRIERGRTRQTMVPDFKISIPEAGRSEHRLFELKVVSSCTTRYPRNPRPEGRAVDIRAKLLQGEYETKAKKADRMFGNTPMGEIGRMQQKLLNFGRVRGLVVRGWGELSEDFKFLLQVMADKIKQELEAQTGVEHRQSVTAQLASYVSLNRQQLSRVCVQAQSRLLLDRLDGLGGGVGEAASRRKRTAWLEARWEKERQANIIAAKQGWRIRRTGDFKI